MAILSDKQRQIKFQKNFLLHSCYLERVFFIFGFYLKTILWEELLNLEKQGK